MTHFQTVILPTLRNRFEINGLAGAYQQNVWIMALAVVSYGTKHIPIISVSKDLPTHTIRLVLRTTDEAGTNDYVDGTDVYIRLDSVRKTAEFVWEGLWAEVHPLFHGGTVPDALRWVRELAEPFYVQHKDPFLTSEQRVAMNGHDEDYAEYTHEQRREKTGVNHLTDDDFDGIF